MAAEYPIAPIGPFRVGDTGEAWVNCAGCGIAMEHGTVGVRVSPSMAMAPSGAVFEPETIEYCVRCIRTVAERTYGPVVSDETDG